MKNTLTFLSFCLLKSGRNERKDLQFSSQKKTEKGQEVVELFRELLQKENQGVVESYTPTKEDSGLLACLFDRKTARTVQERVRPPKVIVLPWRTSYRRTQKLTCATR